MIFVCLPSICVLDVHGKDAARIANNLCTADVVKLETGQGREAFVTDIRGKTVGHVCVFRADDGLRMIGAGPAVTAIGDAPPLPNQATAIAAHLDRYTLREQSVPEDKSELLVGIVIDAQTALRCETTLAEIAKEAEPTDLRSVSFTLGQNSQSPFSGRAYQVPWWQGGALLLIIEPGVERGIEPGALQAAKDYLTSIGANEASMAEFHRLRIKNRFPWFGVDLDASHLPQEADRDQQAISFTKGCYLGQETIARLDAMGQVQKKLVQWRLKCPSIPASGTELKDGDRVIGRLTSVALQDTPNEYLALGFARRTHFDLGSKAMGLSEDGSSIDAIVGISQ